MRARRRLSPRRRGQRKRPRGDRRRHEFANTSLWLTTTRKWVTLSGCVRTQSQRRALVKFVAAQPMVERVFDETRVGTRGGATK